MIQSNQPDYLNIDWLQPDHPPLYDWYDEFYDDLEMWNALCSRFEGPVLDLACGTGRVSIALARAGMAVVGVDISQHMVARALNKLTREESQVCNRIDFIVGDMTSLELDSVFQIAIIPSNSLNELTTFEAQEACLRSVWQHLAPGGILAVVAVPENGCGSTSEPEEPVDLWERKPFYEAVNPASGLLTRQWILGGWGDPSLQLHYHRFYFEEVDESGISIRRFALPPAPKWHVRRFIGRYEMQLLLEKCGFAVENIYGDYQLGRYGPQSTIMVIEARKMVQRHE